MDVGCYPSSAARLVAGAAPGKPFLNPIEVKASGVIGHTGVDTYTSAVLKFENDVIGQISTAVACKIPGEVTVFGTDGILTVPNPWLPSTPCRTAKTALKLDTTFPSSEIHLQRKSETEVITIDVDRDLFTYEADVVANNIISREAPAMSWADTEGNIRLLAEWRAQIDLTYPQDS